MAETRAKKMGIYSFIGVLVFALGLGFTLFQPRLDTSQNNIYFLSLENQYTANITLSLENNDRLLLYISPIKNVNYNLSIRDSTGIILALNSTQITDKTLELSINKTDTYTLTVSETPPLKYTQLNFDAVTLLSQPPSPYIVLGLPLLLAGAALSLIGLKEIGFFRPKSGLYYRYTLKELSLISFSIILFAVALVLLASFLIDLVIGNWLNITLLVFLLILNFTLVYEVSLTLKEDKLRLFSITLFALAYIWIPISFTLIDQSQLIIYNSYSLFDEAAFTQIKIFSSNYGNLYYQTLLFIILIPLFYVYLGYNQGKTALTAIFEKMEKMKISPLDADLNLLREQLIYHLGKGDVKSFFATLKGKSIEASAILYLTIKSYVENKLAEVTYHKLILDYSDLFNKKLYERKPFERVLEPLRFIDRAGERFKVFRLNTELEEIKTVAQFLSRLGDDAALKEFEECSGVSDLRDRKTRFSGAA